MAGGITGDQERTELLLSDKGGAFREAQPLPCINLSVCEVLLPLIIETEATYFMQLEPEIEF